MQPLHTGQFDRRPEARPIGDAPVSTRDGFSLLNVALSGRRHVIAGALAAAFATFVALSFVDPTFEADSQIILEPNSAAIIDIPDVISEAPDGVATIEGAIIVMRSPAIMRAVVTRLGLTERADFEAATSAPGLKDRIKSGLSGLVGLVAGGDTAGAGARPVDDAVARTARSLRKAVSVRSIGESRVIEITTTLGDPGLAAEISNAVAEEYLGQQIARQEDAATRATAWLEDRAEQLRDDLIASERRMGNFRREMLSNGRHVASDLETRQSETTERITELTQQRATLAGLRREVSQLLGTGNFATLALAADLPSITLAVEHLAETEGRIIELRAEYGDHPQTLEAQRARDLLMERIRTETEQFVAGLDVRIGVLDSRLSSLETQLGRIRGDLVEAQQDGLNLLTLEREADAAREVFELFALRLREVRERGQLPSPGARLVSEAEPPSAPVAPQKTKLAGLAGIAGGGGVLVLLVIFRTQRTAITILDDPRLQKGTSRIVDLPRPDRLRTPDDLMTALQGTEDEGLVQAMRWCQVKLGPRSSDWANLIVVASAEETGAPRPSTFSLVLAQSFGQEFSTVLIDANPTPGMLGAFAEHPDFDRLGFWYVDFTGSTMDDIERLIAVDNSHNGEEADAIPNAEILIIDVQSVPRAAAMHEVGQLSDHVVLTRDRDKPGETALRRLAALARAAVPRAARLARRPGPVGPDSARTGVRRSALHPDPHLALGGQEP